MTKILIIDDQKHILDVVEDCLVMYDYEVVRARSGREGLSQLEKTSPDLVVCDVDMPEMNGHTLLHVMRERSDFADIPFVFLTGNDAPTDQRASMEMGADDYLCKPFQPRELINTVQARLKKAEMIRQKYALKMAAINERMTHLKNFDEVTNLPNMSLLKTKFIQLKEQLNNPKMALLSLSVDHFKELENVYSGPLSRAVLKYVSNSIKSVMESQFDLLYYLKNDQYIFDLIYYSDTNEFLILMPLDDSNSHLTPVGQKLLNKLNQPFKVMHHHLHISASIGVSLYPLDTLSLDDLVFHAQKAKSKSQEMGGNQIQFFL